MRKLRSGRHGLTALCLSLPMALACKSALSEAVHVTIEKDQGRYQLLLDGEPFVVRGVGGANRLSDLAAAGGNSFRTWSTENLDEELAQAQSLGLMVAVGIATGKQLLGFDYNDEAAVAEQFKRVTAIIDKYKDHPNILCWVIANEPNLYFNDQGQAAPVNPKVYDALGEIIDYIHEHDPKHPVTYSFAGADKTTVQNALQRTPQVDIISVQVYGDLAVLADSIEAIGIDKPFMVTEFGPVGHWERPVTAWGREIEEPSAVKAEGMAKRLEDNILKDPTGKLVGTYAFLWGQKQERTPTWYGMFNESGEKNARVDELSRLWTGQYPQNRAPLSYAITLNNQVPEDSVIVDAGELVEARVKVSDPDGDALESRWVLMDEVGERSHGGHFEARPKELDIEVIKEKSETGAYTLRFRAPARSGEYRLFSYVYDTQDGQRLGGVGNANFPFKVK